MKYGFFDSPLGIIKISYGEKIKKIELVEEIERPSEESEIFNVFKSEILEYLTGKRKTFSRLDLLDLRGTDFQKSVWKALLKIPYGKTCSYKDLSKMISKPKAMRAVGTAVGKNPFLIIIPCHRVIKNNGTLGGFAYGPHVKKALLKIEGHDF